LSFEKLTKKLIKMNTSKRLYFNLSVAAIIFVIIFHSCNSSVNQENAQNAKKVDSSNVKAQIKIPYSLSTPLEITKMLNEAGAGYIITISNPVKSIDKYVTEKSKALNLGVYGADLSYSSTYNKIQETTNFFNNAKKLTEDLGILNAFTENEIKRIEKNIDKNDSLYQIITGSFEKTYQSLNEMNKGQVSAFVIAGGWVEGVYIATQLAKTSQKNEKIAKGIFEQKITLDKLIATLELYKDNAEVVALTDQLKPLKEVYAAVTDKMTDKQLDDFTAKIEAIRESFVK